MAPETWRLLSTWDRDARFHMGFDALQLERGCARPTLRLYTWRPDALSLGYFQRVAEVRDRARTSEVVRRMTGGGAIHHVNELTFSITVPAGHPLYHGPVAGSYVRVHGAIARALAAAGVRAELRGTSPVESDRDDTGMCFHASTPLDLVWGGRKGVGSAQRRTSEGILHHGSIKLAPSELEAGVATVAEAGGSPVTALDFAPLLCRALEDELGLRFAASEPDDDELRAARELGEVFGSREMVERR